MKFIRPIFLFVIIISSLSLTSQAFAVQLTTPSAEIRSSNPAYSAPKNNLNIAPTIYPTYISSRDYKPTHVVPEIKLSWWERQQTKIGNWANGFAERHESFNWATEHWYVPAVVCSAPLVVAGGAWVAGGFVAVTPAAFGAAMATASLSSLIAGSGQFLGDYLNAIGQGHSLINAVTVAYNNISFDKYFASMAAAFYLNALFRIFDYIRKGYTLTRIGLESIINGVATAAISVGFDLANGQKLDLVNTLIVFILTTLLFSVTRSKTKITGPQAQKLMDRMFRSGRANRFWEEQAIDGIKEAMQQEGKQINKSLQQDGAKKINVKK